MNISFIRPVWSALATILFVTLACGGSGAASPSEPNVPVAPMAIGSDLTAIDVCQAIPREDMEALMGKQLAQAPEGFDYSETGDTSGCWYQAKPASDGEAFFSYVVLTPLHYYDEQPLYLNEDVSGIGDEAYFNNGADARQLWVKIDDKVAFVVANGDVENEAGLLALAKLVAAAIE